MKKFEYPMTYLVEVAFFILLGIAELLFYIPYFNEYIIKIIPNVNKMSELKTFIGVIISIVVVYIYILSKIYLLMNINEYVKNENMIRTYINDEKNGLKVVESLFIDDKGKVIVERKDKSTDNQNNESDKEFLIERNYYNQYDEIEYYTSSKQKLKSPSGLLMLLPFFLVLVNFGIFYSSVLKEKGYLPFNIGIFILIITTFFIANFYSRKSKEVKQKNERKIINEAEQFIKHSSDVKLKKKKILAENLTNTINDYINSNNEKMKNTIKQTIESEVSKL
ncbi:hypothetical protein [Staphylococcus hominis]|uniref:hypothetical protein n=1 Tax=Staphylococcus hominis TaxID=1290 RepID=UPI00119FDDED|nr:hypothetical protein [Staphylococcus hominis]